MPSSLKSPQATTTPIAKKQPQAIFFNDFKNSYIPQILEEIYIKQVYKPFVEGKRDMVIVDVGANIGLTAFYFKDYAKKVYAVEPSKQHIEIIQRLIDHNKITNIEIVPLALSNKNGKERFYHNENVTMFSLESMVNNKEDFEEVGTVTMDQLFKLLKIDHIDLLKLDPEGHEMHIVSSPEFAKMAPQIKVICGEWHQWAAGSKELFMNNLRDLGYQFKWANNTDASVYTAIRV